MFGFYFFIYVVEVEYGLIEVKVFVIFVSVYDGDVFVILEVFIDLGCDVV